MFDLDLALTTPTTTWDVDPGRDDSKVWGEELINSSSKQNQITDQLPTVSGGGIAGGGACAVCMEGFKPGAGGKQVPCGHVFHANCIEKWLSVQNSCPLCRFSISAAAAAAATAAGRGGGSAIS